MTPESHPSKLVKNMAPGSCVSLAIATAAAQTPPAFVEFGTAAPAEVGAP